MSWLAGRLSQYCGSHQKRKVNTNSPPPQVSLSLSVQCQGEETRPSPVIRVNIEALKMCLRLVEQRMMLVIRRYLWPTGSVILIAIVSLLTFTQFLAPRSQLETGDWHQTLLELHPDLHQPAGVGCEVEDLHLLARLEADLAWAVPGEVSRHPGRLTGAQRLKHNER